MSIRNTPIIIGIGEICEQTPKDLTKARSVIDLAASAAEEALTDSGKPGTLGPKHRCRCCGSDLCRFVPAI